MFEIRPILSALTRHKSGALLIILQVALTLAVVSNAAFIIKQRLDLMERETGVVESELIRFAMFYYGEQSGDRREQHLRNEQMLRSKPGVIDAAVTNMLPIDGGGDSTQISNKLPDEPNAITQNLGFYRSTTAFPNTLGLELEEGRWFTDDELVWGDDTASIDKVILTRATADALFPENNAMGQTVYLFDQPMKVIGIVRKLQAAWASWPYVEHAMIVPSVRTIGFTRFLIRAEPEYHDEIIANLSSWIAELNPNAVITGARTFKEVRENAYRDDAAMTKILLTVIVLLVLVTALGIVGLATFSVNQRTKQIGVRRALGASKTAILRYFLVENALLTLGGSALGVALAIWLSDFLGDHYRLPPLESEYIGVTLIALIAIGLVAVFMPAMRAARISPATATRTV